MKSIKVMSITLGLLLLAGAVAIQSQGQTSERRTEITFNQPVSVPGMALPTGKYTFTILDVVGSRNVVQIWNGDRTELLTTVLAINNYRLQPTGETVLEYHERPAGQPQAIKAWFYPGDNGGIEFVYPKQEAARIAKAANEPVPAEEVAVTPSTLRTVPLIAISPDSVVMSIDDFETIDEHPPVAGNSPGAARTNQTAERATVAQTLPRTASSTPLIALLGFLALGVGIGIKRFMPKPQ